MESLCLGGKRIDPKISIIIPTFNRANYLVKAIESALVQDYEKLEIIVSDNASTDNTSEIVGSYLTNNKFKYFRNEKNIGMVSNWRKSLNEYATGDFFLILSDDDYFIDNNYISKAVDIIKNHPDIVIVYANGYILNEEKNKKLKLNLPFKGVEDGKKIFLSKGTIRPQDLILCNVIFNRSLAMDLNAFSNDYNISCDSELFLKMCLFGKIGIINDFVSVYLIHSDNLIDKLNDDFKILINNLDYLLEPYNLAKKMKILSKSELEEWKNRLIIPEIVFILVEIIIYHPEKYEKALDVLKEKNPEELIESQKIISFRIFLLLSKIHLHVFAYKLFRFIKGI